jgi:hypothetical protein
MLDTTCHAKYKLVGQVGRLETGISEPNGGYAVRHMVVNAVRNVLVSELSTSVICAAGSTSEGFRAARLASFHLHNNNNNNNNTKTESESAWWV